MSWYQRRQRIESNAKARVGSLPAIAFDVDEQMGQYHLLIELKARTDGPALISGLFNMKLGADGRFSNLALATFAPGDLTFPPDTLALNLAISITVIRKADSKCMALCVDAPVGDVEESYIYMDTTQGASLIPPHLGMLFGEGPSDLTPQVCIEAPVFTDDDRTAVISFDSISIGYFDPFDDSSDLKASTWLHMWRHIDTAWI